MANPTELVNGEAENTTQNEEDAQSNEKKHDKAACADLERITDYAEDKTPLINPKTYSSFMNRRTTTSLLRYFWPV